MTNFEKIAEMLGVEFDKPFKIKGYEVDYIINDKGFQLLVSKSKLHDPDARGILYELLRGELEIDRWPEEGDRYYHPSVVLPSGTRVKTFDGDTFDHIIKKRVGIYRTKEEAKEKARELGWLDD